jgi:hypothetical protein
MWQQLISHLPDVLPFPDIAIELFQYVELAALALGVLTAIILFAKSKTKGFRGIFWSRRFALILIVFLGIYFIYYVLYETIKTPPIPLMYFEAFLFFLIYFVFTMVVALIVILAPKRLIDFIKSLFR